jgi:hypothetical protein
LPEGAVIAHLCVLRHGRKMSKDDALPPDVCTDAAVGMACVGWLRVACGVWRVACACGVWRVRVACDWQRSL